MTTDEKNPFLAALLNEVSGSMAKSSGKGMTRSEALSQNKCARCGGDAKVFADEPSRREYSLTAWCQKCQDAFFG